MIPKIIHYTWFSGDEYPDKIKKCIESWRKFLPEYEFKLWDMQMARSLNIPYINEALDCHKWAFASDVVRAYAVWKYGGVYMDTDIMVLKPFDNLVDKNFIFFFERNDAPFRRLHQSDFIDEKGNCVEKNHYIRGRQIQAAIFMGQAGNNGLRDIIEYYKHTHFLDSNGNPNIDVISPLIYAKVLERYGFKYLDIDQQLDCDAIVLNSSFVSGSLYDCKKNTIAIHLAAHSWNKRNLWQEIKYRVRQSVLYKYLNPFKNFFYKKSDSRRVTKDRYFPIDTNI